MNMFKKIIVTTFILILSNPAYAGNIPEINNAKYDLEKIDALMKGIKQANNAVMCFKTGEKISGMNKICYYDCTGSEAAITISSVELCPLSIDR